MSNGKSTQNEPYKIEVVAGETYFWCSCGESKNQPYCDGSHKGTEFSPIKYTADESKRVAFCGCRRSAKTPMCDGTHRNLTEQT